MNQAFGNDLVWLEDPRNQGRSADHRLLNRILGPQERLLVSAAPDPDATLWSLWAAKEAAFKAWSRDQPGLVFSPRTFEVEFLTGEGRARVVRGGETLAVAWNRGPGWVHALASDDLNRVVWAVGALEPGLREGEAVRMLAQQVCRQAGYGPGTVEGRPPVFRTEAGTIPLSLSHDGPYGAAAVILHR